MEGRGNVSRAPCAARREIPRLGAHLFDVAATATGSLLVSNFYLR